MMVTASGLLREQYADSCARLDRVLAGLEDSGFFWQPVAGCWTVYRRDELRAAAHADGSGDWVIDYEMPEPQPVPFTTVACDRSVRAVVPGETRSAPWWVS